jgi:hypothetical protein
LPLTNSLSMTAADSLSYLFSPPPRMNFRASLALLAAAAAAAAAATPSPGSATIQCECDNLHQCVHVCGRS